MEAKGSNCNIGKRSSRKEILEKKKAIEYIIKSASSIKDHLSYLPDFRHYRKNGLYLHLESGTGTKLSLTTKLYIQNLLKLNMEAHYGPEWPDEEKTKRREMVAEGTCYIFVHEITNGDGNEIFEVMDKEHRCFCKGPIVGFVHYRFILEEEVPVVYVYELQLEPRIQGKGIGKFLMQLVELIACKNRMGAVVLTVQRANKSAMDFYIGKLRYTISAISPSRVNPMLDLETSYEILCKTFDHEAQKILEDIERDEQAVQPYTQPEIIADIMHKQTETQRNLKESNKTKKIMVLCWFGAFSVMVMFFYGLMPLFPLYTITREIFLVTSSTPLIVHSLTF